MKTTQMSTGKDCLSRGCYRNEVTHHHLCLAVLEVGRGVGSFMVKERKSSDGHIAGCWHREAGGRLSRSRASYLYESVFCYCNEILEAK